MNEMRSVVIHAAAFAVLAAAFGLACTKGAVEQLSDVGFDPNADGVVVGPDNKPAPTGPAGSGLVTGLPCDVQAVVENRCQGCHEGTTAGAPRLLDYADFKLPSKADPTKTLAEMSLLRLKSTTNPMPPPPVAAPDPDEIRAFESWVTSGTKKGGLCTTPPPPRDGGAPTGGDSGADAGQDAAPPCTSGTMWTMGNTKSPLMHPGGKCNRCHSQTQGPNLQFAGTVYRGAHDVDDCNGAGPPPPLSVIITDKNNKAVTLTVNTAGNFLLVKQQGPGQSNGGNGNGGNGNNGFSPPFKAKVTDGTKTREMIGSVTSGDCNSCHTAAGDNSAPGRILAP